MAASVRDLVTWRVDPTPPEVAVARRVGALLNGAWVVATLGAGATGAPPAPAFTVPDDPDAYVDLGVLVLRGGPRAGLPPPEHGRWTVAATRTAAWVLPTRRDRPSARLPLEDLRLVGASSRSRSRAPRHAAAPWTLALADDAGTLHLDGAWLALAYLGRLAGWPEPA